MKCCSKKKEDEEEVCNADDVSCSQTHNVKLKCGRSIDISANEIPYLWFPSLQSLKQIDYVRKLEMDLENVQKAFLTLTSHFARMQFRLKQVLQAAPSERDALLEDLQKLAFGSVSECEISDELPSIQSDLRRMGDARQKQGLIIQQLRSQLMELAEASENEPIESCEDETCDVTSSNTPICCGTFRKKEKKDKEEKGSSNSLKTSKEGSTHSTKAAEEEEEKEGAAEAKTSKEEKLSTPSSKELAKGSSKNLPKEGKLSKPSSKELSKEQSKDKKDSKNNSKEKVAKADSSKQKLSKNPSKTSEGKGK